MTPSQMRPLTRSELQRLSETTKEELRGWFANKIQIARDSADPDLAQIMKEFNELMKGESK